MNRTNDIKKALVTGATGLVGSYLTAELIGRGVQVVALLRPSSQTHGLAFVLALQGLKLEQVEILRVDTSDFPELRRAVVQAEVDTVFHCAAQVTLTERNEKIVQNNVELTHYMVEACLAASARPKFIHVSSIATVQGSELPSVAAAEGDLFGGMAGASAYARSKFLCEMEVYRGAGMGLQTVVVNPSVVLGCIPGGKGLQPLIEAAIQYGVPFYTDGGNGFIDVTDLAQTLHLLAEKPEAVGNRYIVSGGNHSSRQLIALANHSGGHSRPAIRLSEPLLRYAIKLLRLLGMRNLNPALSQTLSRKNFWNTTKFTQIAGPDFRFKTLDETVEHINLTLRTMNKK